MFYAPNDLYVYTGYAQFAAHPGMNSITIEAIGTRQIKFKDGIILELSNATVRARIHHGIGIYRQRICGDGEAPGYRDHDLPDKVTQHRGHLVLRQGLAKVPHRLHIVARPQDYIKGEIKHNGKTVSTIYGSYVGFVEFDGVRYWDARDGPIHTLRIAEEILPSDSSYRPDLRTLLTGNIEAAQRAKEQLEEAQRHDAKIREQAKKGKKK